MTGGESGGQSQTNKLVAGVALIAIAVVLIAMVASGGGGDDDTGSGDDGGSQADLACTLGPAGVGLIAAGLTRGESVGQILATVGGPAVANLACKQAVETLVADPSEPVDLGIETDTGTVQRETTGLQLAQPPPQQPPTGVGSRALDCLGWPSALLYRLCVDGTLAPPAR